MQIRPLTDSDIPTIARMFGELAHEFIVKDASADDAGNFVRENNADAMRAYITAGMRYHVAERGGKIVGFIAVREQKHLFHMFVDKAHHRQGIAAALWSVARQAAIDAGNPGVFTVNASNYAVPVYQAMGFVPSAPMQCKNGLYYNPMQLDGGRHD